MLKDETSFYGKMSCPPNCLNGINSKLRTHNLFFISNQSSFMDLKILINAEALSQSYNRVIRLSKPSKS